MSQSGQSRLCRGYDLDRFRQPKKLKCPDTPPVDVDLVPGDSMSRGSWVGMMVIVPALAKGQQRDPPVVLRIITRGEPARAPHVRRGVDQPGGV